MQDDGVIQEAELGHAVSDPADDVVRTIVATTSVIGNLVSIISALGILVSGVWLAVLGQWRALVVGIVGILGSVVILSFALVPMLAMRGGIQRLARRGSLAGTLMLTMWCYAYTAVVMTAWALAMLALFVSMSDAHSRVPMLLWSFGLATQPWLYMAAQEAATGGRAVSTIGASFAGLGYGLVILVALLLPAPTLPLLGAVFGVVMLVSVAAQAMVGGVLTDRAVRSAVLSSASTPD